MKHGLRAVAEWFGNLTILSRSPGAMTNIKVCDRNQSLKFPFIHKSSMSTIRENTSWLTLADLSIRETYRTNMLEQKTLGQGLH